jgi:hypothetical protein
VPFNPNAVGYRKMGTMIWTATTDTAGELRYDVDGATVVKNATRLLLVYDDFSGPCGGGDAGVFQFYEMQVNTIASTGRFSATSGGVAGCQITGWFGGLRVTTF